MIRFHKIYILLGSNMQEPAQQLVRAEKMITVVEKSDLHPFEMEVKQPKIKKLEMME